jgi:alkanesulfonate monooxygenase
MPLEVIGISGTRELSELSSGTGLAIDVDYLTRISQVHDEAGFDRVLVGFFATAPDGFAVSSHILSHTARLGVLLAQRAGFIQPTLLARKAATLDHLSGGGRVALHFITGGLDEADQRRDGDFLDHDQRYRRTGECMDVFRKVLTAEAPFDYEGEFYRFEGAFSTVKPLTCKGIPMYFGGASDAALEVGAQHADCYMGFAEPRSAVRERIELISKRAAEFGRQLRFSVSSRPILADTEEAAWARAEEIFAKSSAQAASRRSAGGGSRAGGARNPENSAVSSRRMLDFAERSDVYDERLWMKIANLTGAGGNSSALVGTPEQVAESLLRYSELGATTLLIRGFDPINDAREYGEKLIPLLRSGFKSRGLDS